MEEGNCPNKTENSSVRIGVYKTKSKHKGFMESLSNTKMYTPNNPTV
jgi:hypothetical protein